MNDAPDYNVPILLQAVDDSGNIHTVKVDDTGKLYAMLRAMYGTTPKDLQCDTDGVLKLNIAGQLLSYTTSRSTCGGGIMGETGIFVASSATTSLGIYTGKGVIYGGVIYSSPVSSIINDIITVKVDGNEILSSTWSTVMYYGMVRHGDFIGHLSMYDNVNFKYALNIQYGITFEGTIEVEYTETYGNSPFISSNIVYGLMP